MIKFPKPLTPASPHRGEDKGEGGVILNFVLAHLNLFPNFGFRALKFRIFYSSFPFNCSLVSPNLLSRD